MKAGILRRFLSRLCLTTTYRLIAMITLIEMELLW